MIELPGSLRDLITRRIDEEIENTAPKNALALFGCVMAGLEVAAEELDEDVGENLVTRLEESGELEQSLAKSVNSAFSAFREPSGDELMSVIDGLCEVAWIDEDDDDQIARGFMESDGYDEEEDEY
jgi:hypothetical protein